MKINVTKKQYWNLMRGMYMADWMANAIDSNQQLIQSTSEKYGVDAGLMRGIIYEEQSHLTPVVEPLAESTLYIGDSKISGATIGLGQITKGYYGYSGKDLLESTNNIDAIGQHLDSVRNQLIDEGLETSNAMIASRYNNGFTLEVTDYGNRVSQYTKTQSIISGMQQIVKGLRSILKNKSEKNEK